MKNVIYTALAVIFGMSLLVSCNSGNVEKDIVGEWTIESVDLSEMEEVLVELAKQFGATGDDLEEFKKEMKTDMKGEFEDESITFKEDYTVLLSGESEPGTWSYDEENNTIVVEADGEKIDFVIEELKGDNLEAKFVSKEDEFELKIGMTLKRKK